MSSLVLPSRTDLAFTRYALRELAALVDLTERIQRTGLWPFRAIEDVCRTALDRATGTSGWSTRDLSALMATVADLYSRDDYTRIYILSGAVNGMEN